MVSAPRSCAVGWTKQKKEENEEKESESFEFFGRRQFAVFEVVLVNINTTDGVMMVSKAQISHFISVQILLRVVLHRSHCTRIFEKPFYFCASPTTLPLQKVVHLTAEDLQIQGSVLQ